VTNFGRIVDRDHTEMLIASQRHPTASSAMQFTGDDNATIFLPAIYTKVTGQPWDSMNQNPRGICVSMGVSKSLTLGLAVMASLGKITFPGRVAPGPIYGGARYEIGYQQNGNRPSGNRHDPDNDGAVGSFAGEWVQKRGGVLLMQRYDDIDLSRFDPVEVAEKYGYEGVPDQIEDDAKLHPAKQLTLCQGFDDVWKMLGQLYPVNVCSSQGFSMSRDSNGYCRPEGDWAHCMHYVGRIVIRGKKWIILDNSWEGKPDGSGYLGGTLQLTGIDGVTITLTGNMFLVDPETVDAMCTGGNIRRRNDQRETFAIAGVDGFVQQRPLFLI